ncbi:UNVERIFIED_CONTAM: hypothetical protein Scaly_1413700 [Sesamum calycinum]|uniref:Uncharacterized protein n=1 Tax=Sesamum calycinum TaxID=2727403 RepID=A0AAW2PQ89_9LAMI
MAREGKIGNKRKTRNKVRLEKKGSDESDEDYKVDEDEEFDESEDDYCSSLAEDESEESLGELEEEEEEEEEWVEKKAKKVGKSRRGKGFQGRKKNGLVKPKNKKVAYSEEEEEDYEDDYLCGAKRRKKNKPRKKSRVPKTGISGDSCKENPRDKDKVSYREEKEDSEFDDSDDEDDEEFSPGEVLKRTRKKPGKRQVLKKKNRSNLFKEFRDENHNQRKKKMTTGWGWGRRRKPNVNSDSDFISSGSSDYEYTISEEEREQVREATEFCRRLNPSLRSSNSLKMMKEEEMLPSKTKRPGKKGKQKLIAMKIEVGKQVCGICLSEEGKRTVRGVLNCCSHYFCFACIMEWSKVESRCPLCKQRFATISRTARANDGQDLKDAVFPVPERDQVYQPSEEELRGYLDPYENVLCTECQQGGDDAFMLLCDLCDSPAHTYCVGLGREVPDGNWYCDGCRPTALASSTAQALNPTSDHGATNNSSVGASPVAAVRETFDLNEVYVPDTPLTQVTGHSQSPRPSIGLQATSPASGSGAFTLFERRRIQRQIHQLLNNRSRQSDRSDGMAPASGINLFGSLIGRDMVAATQNTVMPARTAPENIHLQQRLPDYNMPSLYNREVFSPRLSSLRGEAFRNQASTSSDHSFAGLSQNQFAGINAGIGGGLGHQQLHPCGGPSNTGPDANTSAYQFREVSYFSYKRNSAVNGQKSF